MNSFGRLVKSTRLYIIQLLNENKSVSIYELSKIIKRATSVSLTKNQITRLKRIHTDVYRR